MTKSTPDSSTAALLADLYGFLSSVLADPPEPDDVATLRTNPVPDPDVAPNAALRRGLEQFRGWQDSAPGDETAARRLETEHTRLFVGPRPALQVHESYYAGDFLGAPLAAVQATYDRLGVEPTADLREEADHAAVELAALRVLADDHDARRQFLDQHGGWFEPLGDDVRRETDQTFYEVVGWLVEGVVELDRRLLAETQ